MEKVFEDLFGLAQKNPLVALVLSTIFGLYIVGKIETKSLNDSPTQPRKEIENKQDKEIDWAKIVLTQNESISALTKLVNELIERMDENDRETQEP